MLIVEGFSYDEENEEKFASHGLSAEVVDQILDNPYRVLKNRKHRRSPLLLVGVDHGGALYCSAYRGNTRKVYLEAGYSLALQRE
jgi:hypothetical protein